MTQDFKAIFIEAKTEILEGIKHLKYSYNKVQSLTSDISGLSSEDLETWEGLVARFGRVSDIFLSKYIKTYVLSGDPGFRGSLRDFLDQAEKFGIVESADLWMEVRQLRNISVHEYSAGKIPQILNRVRDLTPELLKLEDKVNAIKL